MNGGKVEEMEERSAKFKMSEKVMWKPVIFLQILLVIILKTVYVQIS